MVDINKNPPWFRTATRCKYSGLPISHPDLFVSKHPGSNYFVDTAKLGDQILLVKASGYVRSYEMSEATRFMDEYVLKNFDQKTGIIYVEDYADVEGADSEARKLYIRNLKNNDVFRGWIVYNLPLLYRISFKITKRLHARGKHLYGVASFEQAFDMAGKIITLCYADDSEPLCLPGETSGTSETISRRVSAKFKNYSDKLLNRFRKNITRQYSEALLKHIESIDWHKDGIDAPSINESDDDSVRSVFNAVSYIKSEIDDLLKERNAAEKVLRESEARYRQLVEHAQAGIIEFDYFSSRIISVNDSFLGISGYSKDEIYLMNPVDLMTEESKKIFSERFSLLLAGKILSPESAYQIIIKNGQKKWVLLNTNIIYEGDQPWKAEIIISDITHLKEVENKLIRYQSKLKQLSVQLSKSEEIQRRQLASRLHESVSQELFAAQLKINAMERSLDDPKFSHQLEEIKMQIVKSIKDIRSITYDLSPPVLYDLGLKEAVESLAKSIQAQYSLSVKSRFNGSLEHIDDEIKIIIYRVIKEIIQNAVKHARAGFVSIIIDSNSSRLSVDVTDNGVGFDADCVSEGHSLSDGFGLFDIREKINHLGGYLTIHSTPGSGTRIGFEVPLNEPVHSVLKN